MLHYLLKTSCDKAANILMLQSCRMCSTRINAFGIQELEEKLRIQIFGKNSEPKGDLKIEECRYHLAKHNLLGKPTTKSAPVNLTLPKFEAESIDDHFFKIGENYCKPYLKLLRKLIQGNIPSIPKKFNYNSGWTLYNADGSLESVEYPKDCALVFDIETCMKAGPLPTMATAVSDTHWYSWCSAQLIDENYQAGEKLCVDDFIPLEAKSMEESKHKIVVGHNVGFDRSFVAGDYSDLEGRSKLRYLDTLSMHVCVSGLTSGQRSMQLAQKAKRKSATDVDKQSRLDEPLSPEKWLNSGSLNNLVDVHAFYVGGEKLSKEQRDIFVQGTLSDVRENFQTLMEYCARDVVATRDVLVRLLPIFLERCHNPVSLAGMLEMLTAYLPVNGNWQKYLDACECFCENTQFDLRMILTGIANRQCTLVQSGAYKRDPWLWDLDWSTQEIKYKKSAATQEPKQDTIVKKRKSRKKATEEEILIEKYGSEEADLIRSLRQDTLGMYKKQPFLPGYPAWYRELWERDTSKPGWQLGPVNISLQQRIVPKLLKLVWDGYPLHHHKDHGWGYLVPYKDRAAVLQLKKGSEKILDVVRSTKLFFDDSIKLKFSAEDFDIIFASDKSSVEVFPLVEFLDVCLETMNENPENMGSDHNIKISEVPEEGLGKVWKKLLNKGGFKDEKRDTAPIDIGIPGCRFYKLPHPDGTNKNVGNPFGKDFIAKMEEKVLRAYGETDANKLLEMNRKITYWINSRDRILNQTVVWRSEGGVPGAAILPRIIPAGTVSRRAVEVTWLTASNSYTDRLGSELKSMVHAPDGYHFVGADVDSQELWIAAILGDSASAGIHGCTAFGWMTLQGNKADGTDMHSRTAASVNISRDQAKILNYARIYGAGKSFAARLLKRFNHRLSEKEAIELANKMFQETKGERSGKPITNGQLAISDNSPKQGSWSGGSESEMFNCLEWIALADRPETPVLRFPISQALEPRVVDGNFLTSRVNWVVQSSAVDYLHLMLVCMRWLMDTYNIRGRFSISIHDEVRFLVKSEDRYRAALALQISNLYVRSVFAYALGMRNLPQSVAFFSTVEIDKILRKDVMNDCQTPSNPKGLFNGYDIRPGEALDVYEIINKTGGSLDHGNTAKQVTNLVVDKTKPEVEFSSRDLHHSDHEYIANLDNKEAGLNVPPESIPFKDNKQALRR